MKTYIVFHTYVNGGEVITRETEGVYPTRRQAIDFVLNEVCLMFQHDQGPRDGKDVLCDNDAVVLDNERTTHNGGVLKITCPDEEFSHVRYYDDEDCPEWVRQWDIEEHTGMDRREPCLTGPCSSIAEGIRLSLNPIHPFNRDTAGLNLVRTLDREFGSGSTTPLSHGCTARLIARYDAADGLPYLALEEEVAPGITYEEEVKFSLSGPLHVPPRPGHFPYRPAILRQDERDAWEDFDRKVERLASIISSL